MNAINEASRMEVDEQSDRDIEKFHVAQELRLVDGVQRRDGFKFNENAFFHQGVEAK